MLLQKWINNVKKYLPDFIDEEKKRLKNNYYSISHLISIRLLLTTRQESKKHNIQ